MFKHLLKFTASRNLAMCENTTQKLPRGAFIVVEGVDRTGKTTQCKLLVEHLLKRNIKAEYYNFPARHTQIGQLINEYLKSKKDLSDQVIHLLFSANRWECSKLLEDKLQSGTTLIIDRYCYSGVAFSAAKGLDIKWCKSSDAGLMKPDRVFFLTLPSDKLENRNGYGDERYEVPAFQKKVLDNFLPLKDEVWEVVLADRTIEALNEELLQKTLQVISQAENRPISKIWTDLD